MFALTIYRHSEIPITPLQDNIFMANMHSRFDAFIRISPPADGELPATHMTDCWTLREALDDGILKVDYCSVFGEDLVYCFLGRPFYRPNPDVPANGMIDYASTCLILKPTITSSVVRIFPFDSGGFDLYLKAMHHK
jgi:hypothetical protein